MDKEQLTANIEAKKLLVKSCNEQFRQAESDLALLTAEFEAEKPELRHGDYGLSLTGNHPRLYVFDNGIRWANNKFVEGHDCIPENLILGNIFADLAAMSKDMTEFEIGEDDVITRQNSVVWEKEDERVVITPQKEGSVMISAEELPALIRNFQSMYATMKRKGLTNDTE